MDSASDYANYGGGIGVGTDKLSGLAFIEDADVGGE